MAALCNHCGEFGPEDRVITCTALTVEDSQCGPCRKRAVVRQQIKQLRATYDTIGTEMNAVHDPFIHKFPPEIGSRIFVLSLPPLSTVKSRKPKSKPGLDSITWAWPLKLGSVCRKWRQLAWATPQLWTTVYVRIKLSIAGSLPGLLREWLCRSGTLPLTVYFYEHQNAWFTTYNILFDGKARNALEVTKGLVIDILAPHSGRWRSFHLTASADVMKRFSESISPTQLNSLELAFTFVRRSPATPEFITEPMPNLTELKLSRFPVASLNVLWDNITHATVSEVVLSEALELLRRASNLDYYCVTLADQGEVGPIIPVVHPRLRSLELRGPRIRRILSEITLPSLEEWAQDVTRQSLEDMQSFVQRSRSHVKLLKLNCPILFPGAFNPLLQKLPSVERIHLNFRVTEEPDEDPLINEILIQLFDSDPENRNPEPFLPHLQLLECKPDGAVAFSWDLLPKWYRDGNRRPLKLRSFAYESQITDKIAFELLQLEEEGLDLQIISEKTGEDILESYRISRVEAST
ncbi:hypothetical protein M413DRAFT_292318 [Hebeloma cylindrosporum]|uniref:Uncharacterized protein n=1 Tax=Hebeloma cylindrosporum TaxID=76867 RepID=A0A0C2XEM0_HEBCY|nr:hypothetical protein M413DRAFT_292318 [Hebeloma cylindrosporum h7]